MRSSHHTGRKLTTLLVAGLLFWQGAYSQAPDSTQRPQHIIYFAAKFAHPIPGLAFTTRYDGNNSLYHISVLHSEMDRRTERLSLFPAIGWRSGQFLFEVNGYYKSQSIDWSLDWGDLKMETTYGNLFGAYTQPLKPRLPIRALVGLGLEFSHRWGQIEGGSEWGGGYSTRFNSRERSFQYDLNAVAGIEFGTKRFGMRFCVSKPLFGYLDGKVQVDTYSRDAFPYSEWSYSFKESYRETLSSNNVVIDPWFWSATIYYGIPTRR